MDADKARALLKSYLSKRLRVEIRDGRIIEGSFMCTDRDRNIVLSNCEEYYGWEEVCKYHVMQWRLCVTSLRSRAPSSSTAELEHESQVTHHHQRTLGMAIVPGEHIRTISMATELSTPPPATDTAEQ